LSTPSTLRRTGIAGVATTLALGATVAFAGPAAAEADFKFTRIAGADRYETAAKAANTFGAADTVILASGEPGSYPDALSANYLAGLRDAPVLLTRDDRTPQVVLDAIEKSGATDIVLVGGTGVISQAQEEALQDAKYAVTRVAGDDRYATAAAVIAAGDEAAGDTALLATGLNFPDALGAGPVAFAEEMPLAITKAQDAPDNVVAALKQAGIDNVLVLGGTPVGGEAVVEELAENGIALTKRFAGADRGETSALFAQYAMESFGTSNTGINVASGYVKGDGADALGGAALTGQQGRALLITKSDLWAGQAVLDFLGKHADTLTEGFVFGGQGAMTLATEFGMEQAVLGSGALNTSTHELYNDVQSAIDDAEADALITAFGPDLAGFTVNKSHITIQGGDAVVEGQIQVIAADDVILRGFTVRPGTVAGTTAGIYVDDVDGLSLVDLVVDGINAAPQSRGVINALGGAEEAVTLILSTFENLTTGVHANETAKFTIDRNEFLNNAAGSGNDAAGQVITDNRFVNNDEGIGMSAGGSTITGNYFANNNPNHVHDYTADKAYDLAEIIGANEFDEAVKVTEDDAAIQDAG
jgi:putative cell wall-binding protein